MVTLNKRHSDALAEDLRFFAWIADANSGWSRTSFTFMTVLSACTVAGAVELLRNIVVGHTVRTVAKTVGLSPEANSVDESLGLQNALCFKISPRCIYSDSANVLVSGGTGSGGSSMLEVTLDNALSLSSCRTELATVYET